jgi:hypothetical protein
MEDHLRLWTAFIILWGTGLPRAASAAGFPTHRSYMVNTLLFLRHLIVAEDDFANITDGE